MRYPRGVVHPKVCLRKRKVCSSSKRLMYARQREGRDPVLLLLRDHPTTATAFSALGASRHEALALPPPTQASRPLWAKARGCPALHVSRPSDATSPRRRALAPSRSRRPRMCTPWRALARCSDPRALHHRSVATRPASMGRWTSEARIGVEATPRPQTEEDLAWSPLQSLLHLETGS